MQGRYLIQPSPHVLICFYAAANRFNPDSIANPYF